MSTTTRQEKKTGEAAKKPRRVHSARVKCEAVLAIWAQTRKPMEVCRELGIKWASLNQWQNCAMAAMLAALEPRAGKDPEQPRALGPKLEKLLERTERRTKRMNRLEKRLETIQTSTSTPSGNN